MASREQEPSLLSLADRYILSALGYIKMEFPSLLFDIGKVSPQDFNSLAEKISIIQLLQRRQLVGSNLIYPDRDIVIAAGKALDDLANHHSGHKLDRISTLMQAESRWSLVSFYQFPKISHSHNA